MRPATGRDSRSSRSRRKAFIAAPLVGTMVFLICLMLVIALNRTEAARVDEIVSQAYHNRLASLVEIFRSDLGSNFNQGLQRTIEYGLTSQCWFNFAPIRTQDTYSPYYTSPAGVVGTGQYVVQANIDGSSSLIPDNDDYLALDRLFQSQYPGTEGKINEAKDRYHICRRFKELAKQTVCPQANGLQGLPVWVESFRNDVSFEGIQFSLANPESVGYFKNAPPETSSSVCSKIAELSSFDCFNFATNSREPFHCCKETDPSTGDCKDTDGNSRIDSADWIAGACTDGSFNIPIKVSKSSVFKYLPRIQASDSAGNVIRAGAIADRNFQAPVTYPLFKYLDEAFKFNRKLALGSGGSGVLRGVVQGACEGESANPDKGCSQPGFFVPRLDPSIRYGAPPNPDPVAAKTEATRKFFTNLVTGPDGACTLVENDGIHTAFCLTSGVPTSCASRAPVANCNWDLGACAPNGLPFPGQARCDPDCPANAPYELVNPDVPGSPLVDCQEMSQSRYDSNWEQIASQFAIASSQCEDTKFCGTVAKDSPMQSGIVFFDNAPGSQVDPDGPNTFCWLADSRYLGSNVALPIN